MTVCIAARSLVHNCVVAACDMMLSVPNAAVPATDDAAIKIMPLWNKWSVLYAGDPTYAESVVDRAKNFVRHSSEDQDSINIMRAAMRSAYLEELRAQISDQILGKYDMTVRDFRRSGKKQFAGDFEILNKQVRDFRLSTSFLVWGIDKGSTPHIFSVNDPNGNQRIHDARGHGAIGTGAQMALGVLGARPIAILPIRDLIYRVCEAKFTAETAPGVGMSRS